MNTKDIDFAHLHNHAGHSLLDGLQKFDVMCAHAASIGQTSIALTDHYSLGGSWKFAKAARKAAIKPILGLEAGLAFGSRHEQNAIIIDTNDDGEAISVEKGKPKRKTYQHITLLAENAAGWANLVAINNAAQDSHWYKPRADMDLLAEHADGVIVLTGCVGGPVAGALLRNDYDTAKANLQTLVGNHGGGNVYVEIMDHGIRFDRRVNEALIALARDVFGPTTFRDRIVATNDAHYTTEDAAHAHEAWLCGQTGAHLADPTTAQGGRRFAFQGGGYFLRSADQMRAIFDRYEGADRACVNTLAIAERVEADVLPSPGIRLPSFRLPDGYTGTARDLLYEKTKVGAVRRWGSPLPEKVKDRLRFENDVIDNLSEKAGAGVYIGNYLLIVADLIDFARSEGIRVGPGRGSAAGSAVSYALGIVNVDPIANGLLFERFLDVERIGMPDIDTDYDVRGRSKVIEYAQRKYGEDCVARIGTYGVSLSKASLQKAASALGRREVAEKLSRRVPTGGGGKPLPFRDLLNPEDSRAADFRDLVALTPGASEVVELACQFEGVVAAEGIHACGVLISDEPLGTLVPLRRDRRDPSKGGTGGLITQWDGKDIDDLGFMKIDFLGLRNLDVEAVTVDQIERLTGERIDTDNLPTDPADPRVAKTWELLSSGNTAGVFQLESEGMKKLIQRVQPDSLADLSAVVALYRPGPLGAAMHDRYALRKAGEEAVDYSIYTNDPEEQRIIATVLGETFGTVVYQEALMRLGSVVAGFGPATSNKLRRAISKKVPEEIAEIKDLFLGGAQAGTDDAGGTKHRFRRGTAEALWRAFEKSGDYLFNKCLTGDTVLSTSHNSTWKIADLHRKVKTIDVHRDVCAWCGGRSPQVRGLCRGCYGWHEKFNAADKGLFLLSYDFADGRIRPKRIKDVHANGQRAVWRIVLADGKRIRATGNHRFFTGSEWITVDDVVVGQPLAVDGGYEPYRFTAKDFRTTVGARRTGGRVYAEGAENAGWVDGGFAALTRWTAQTRPTAACAVCGADSGRLERAHLDGDRTRNEASNLSWMCVGHHKQHGYRHNARRRQWGKGHAPKLSEVVEKTFAGVEDTFDVEMDDENHNFIANGLVSHNSHSAAYGQIAYETGFLKANWPGPFGAGLLTETDDDERRQAALQSLRAEGIVILGPDVNTGDAYTSADVHGNVRLGMAEVFGLKANALRVIAERDVNGPFTSLADLVVRVKAETGANLPINNFEALIECGACDQFGPRLGMSTVVRALRDNPEMGTPAMEWGVAERSSRERYRLKVNVGVHPLTALRDQIKLWREATRASTPIPLHRLTDDGRSVVTVGVVTRWEERTTKTGRMANMTIESSKTSMDAVVWASVLAGLAADDAIPAVGEIVGVTGRLKVSRITRRMAGTSSDIGLDFDDDDPDNDGTSAAVLETYERREMMVDRIWRGPLDDANTSNLISPTTPIRRASRRAQIQSTGPSRVAITTRPAPARPVELAAQAVPAQPSKTADEPPVEARPAQQALTVTGFPTTIKLKAGSRVRAISGLPTSQWIEFRTVYGISESSFNRISETVRDPASAGQTTEVFTAATGHRVRFLFADRSDGAAILDALEAARTRLAS